MESTAMALTEETNALFPTITTEGSSFGPDPNLGPATVPNPAQLSLLLDDDDKMERHGGDDTVDDAVDDTTTNLLNDTDTTGMATGTGTDAGTGHTGTITTTNDDADDALDSILETSVAEVNLALSHHDASTAAAAAAIADAALHAADIALSAAAVDAVAHLDHHHHHHHNSSSTAENGAAAATSHTSAVESNELTTQHPPRPQHDPSLSLGYQGTGCLPLQLGDSATSNMNAANINASSTLLLSGHKRTISEHLSSDERKADLVKNLNMNVESPPNVDASGHRVGRWTLDEKILFLFGLQKYGKGRWKKISTYVPQRSLVQIKSHAQKVLKRLESGEDVFGRLEENVSRLQTLVAQIHQANGLAPPIVILQSPLPPPQLSSVPQQQSRPTAVTAIPSPFHVPTAVAAATVLVPTPIKPEDTTVPTPTLDGGVVAVVAVAAAGTSTATSNGVSTTTAATHTSVTTHHKQRRLIKKKDPNGTEHILAASALCQLAGPESEGNSSNNSMADTVEDSTPMTAMTQPDVVVVANDDAIMAGDEVVDGVLEF